MQFLIPLAARGEPLFRQIYAGLRRAVLAGKVRAGERLPSTRDLDEQLVAEGFAVGRVGSGTYVPTELVASRPPGSGRSARLKLSRYGSFAASTGRSIVFPEPRRSPLPYYFAYGRSVVA